MKSNLKRAGFIFACVAPAVILFAIFMVAPTFNVFRLSLYQRSTFNPNEVFIGLKNFEMLMKDTNFIRSMQNMLLLIVMVTVFTMATALVFAGILTREKLRGQDFFRIVFYIPNILSVVVISGIITVILFNFLSFWNEYIIIKTLVTDKEQWTLPAGLLNLMQAQQSAAEYGPMYAGLVLVMLPVLILYICVQKNLTKGMTVGGLKG